MNAAPPTTPWTPRDSRGRFLPDPHLRHHCDQACVDEANDEAAWIVKHRDCCIAQGTTRHDRTSGTPK